MSTRNPTPEILTLREKQEVEQSYSKARPFRDAYAAACPRKQTPTFIAVFWTLFVSALIAAIVIAAARRLNPEIPKDIPGKNLLLNPGFESSDGSIGAAYWIAVPQTGSNEATIARDSDSHCFGRCSLAISRYSACKEPQVGSVQRVCAVPMSDKLYLTGSIKTRGQAEAFLRVYFLDSSERVVLSSFETKPLARRKDWKSCTVAVQAPPQAGSAYVALVVQGRGTAWFDRIRLVSEDYWASDPSAAQLSQWKEFSNGGFENNNEGFAPPGWTSPGTSANASGHLDARVKRSGRWSARVDIKKKVDRPVSWLQKCLAPAPPGGSVVVRAYYLSKNAKWAGISVRCLDDRLRVISQLSSTGAGEADGKTGWTCAQLPFVVPPGCRYLMVEPMAIGPGEVWFDDISVIRLNNDPVLLR